jgi:myo-inositol-1(or 4)-monophosphatase
MEEYLAFAEALVRGAADHVLRGGEPVHLRDKHAGDLLTSGDQLADEYIRAGIIERFPDHGIVSEESGDLRSDAEYVWIVDPIDGTKHYAQNLPLYSVAVALRRGTKPVLGAVCMPGTNQLFSAAEGNGARLNGERIRCSGKERLSESLVWLEISSRHSDPAERERSCECVRLLIEHTLRIRVLGVSSLGLCWTAMGGFDAYVHIGRTRHEWDILPGRVVLEESGAVFSNLRGGIVAGPATLHDQLIKLLDLA